jgi:hypothetical protein
VVKSCTEYSPLDADVLRRHFTATRPEDVCGLHITAPDQTYLVTIVDIDAHSDDADLQANFALALHVYHTAQALGFDVLLLDSNGKGGYHVWIIHRKLIPMWQSFRLGKWLIRDYQKFGVKEQPESFPKNDHLVGKRIGNFIRLPGRHPKRDHYTRVWDDDRKGWRSGAAAVRAILRCRGRAVDVAQVVPADFTGKPPRKPARPRLPRPGSPPAFHSTHPVGSRAHARDLAWAESALRALGADFFDDYDSWVEVGMALSELGEPRLELWAAWSKQSDVYDDADDDFAAKWASFAPGAGITLGTLFHWAKAEGWVAPTDGRRRRRGSLVITARKIKTQADGSHPQTAGKEQP